MNIIKESYWRKTLSDGSYEFGKDSEIQRGVSSWTKGRQDIISAALFLDGKTIWVTYDGTKIPLWGQYDNFCFSTSSGKSVRLSREIRCSTAGCTRLAITSDIARIYNIASHRLNNDFGIPIPDNAKELICRIWTNGKIEYTWG